MEENTKVEYTIHQDIVEWMQRANRRWFIICILLIVLLVGSWIGFFVYESQFEDVSVTQDIDTGEGDAVVAGVGDVNYGEDKAAS